MYRASHQKSFVIVFINQAHKKWRRLLTWWPMLPAKVISNTIAYWISKLCVKTFDQSYSTYRYFRRFTRSTRLVKKQPFTRQARW